MRNERLIPLWLVASVLFTVGTVNGAISADKPFSGVTLRVGTWGGSWRDAREELVGQKLKALGAKVEYVIGTPRDNMAKLLAARAHGNVPIDVMEVSPELTIALGHQGLLENISYEAIPNSKYVADIYKAPTAIATQVLELGIAYNKRKFDELNIEAPSSFSDLFNPKLSGHVAMSDVNADEAPYYLYALARLDGGSLQNLEPGFKRLRELNPAYNYSSSTALATKFTLGEIWAAPWHRGWVLRVGRGGFPLAFADVKVGEHKGMIEEEQVVIVKGTKAQKAAEYWINEMLEPDAQIQFARKTGVVPTNEKALAMLPSDPELKNFMWKTADQEQAFHMDWEALEPKMPKIVDEWSRAMAR